MTQLAILSCFTLSLAACGDDGMMMVTDTGTGDTDVPDTGTPDTDVDTSRPPPPPSVCESPITLAGEMGTVSVSGDTSAVDTGAVDLGADCGNAMAARFAPQEVVAYTVPGTVPIAVEFTTAADGTADDFDTLIQVRSDCTMLPPNDPQSCFDDIDPGGGDFRSRGAIAAMGGDTVFFIVTGYAETPVDGYTDRGAWTLEVTARQNTAPTLTGGTMRIIDGEFEGNLQGMDPDGDIDGWQAIFLDDAGDPVDLNGDMMPDTEGFFFRFDEPVDGMTDIDAYTTIDVIDEGPPPVTFYELIMDSGATQIEAWLIDRIAAESAHMTFSIDQPTVVGIGETCDDVDIVCSRDLDCISSTCEWPAAVTAACMGATAVDMARADTTATTDTQSGTVEMAAGDFVGSCGNTASGGETLYNVRVRGGGTYDLIASTNNAATGDADTVVYIRSTCEDTSTEEACHDDVDGMAMPPELASTAEALDISSGFYTVIVEVFGGAMMSTPFDLDLSVRPVLATGATCDVAEVDNRCAGGACAAGTCP